MTPKEKAEEILGKMCGNINSALIAVNEIIESWQSDGNKRLDVGIVNYWQEVKSELEKLK